MQRRRTTPPEAERPARGGLARAGGAVRGKVGASLRGLSKGVRRFLPPPAPIEEAVERILAPHLARDPDAPFWRQWRGTLRLLWPLGDVSRGNAVELLGDGDEVFEAMWAAIRGAERRVLFTTYILEEDAVGRRFQEELVAAAERGVTVSVVLDAFGSGDLPSGYVRALEAAGAEVHWFNPILRLRTRFSRLVRNHRKILVVDEELAFCGGMNASEDYAGERFGNGLFRDAHLCLRGPCARDLADLHRASILQMRARPPAAFQRADERADGTLIQVLESNVRREQRAIQKALHLMLVRAVERVVLTSPYFVPPPRLVRDLVDAAERGVEVRVLTAGVSDVPAVTMASRHLYGRLLKAGVRVFEMQERTLHAKTAAVDGLFASVGSFNLDYISYRRNLEVTVAILDEAAASAVETRFEEDLALSDEVLLDAWRQRGRWERFRDWVAYRLLSL